ncbi:MAG: polyprenyl synthetase family protein [Pseudomonadota bacterium]
MFQDALTEAAAQVHARLEAALSALPASPVRDGMFHALTGGKGLRGFLVLEGAKLHGVPTTRAVHAAAAIEAMHAYSLVHDDLPCMDDDDLRRGRPTVHVKWDEATAVLVGDALQTLAFELAADPGVGAAEIRADLCLSLARAAGARGMVLGQAQDMAAEAAAAPLDLDRIMELQRNKTGTLIRWSAEAGARLAGADIAPLAAYAGALGLAFQIADDILDVTVDAGTAGKRTGKDAEAGKATFVSLMGLDGARSHAASLVDQANAAIAPYGGAAKTLRQAAEFVISRDH